MEERLDQRDALPYGIFVYEEKFVLVKYTKNIFLKTKNIDKIIL